MRIHKLPSCAVLGLLFGSAAVQAEEPDLPTLLQQNTHSISLAGSALSGPGAELLMRLAEGTQFVALGEEHYNYYIPGITTALFQELQARYEYHYFMTEQDPVMMELYSGSPVRGNPEMVNGLAMRYPMGITFNSDQELKMLSDLGRISEAQGDVIWGCDQGSGVTHVLDQLIDEIDDEQALAAVHELRARAADAESVRDFKTAHFIADAGVDVFEELKSRVNPLPGSRAEWLLDVLINSSIIFGYYENGSNGLLPGYYENNRYREEHLKDLCLSKYRATEKHESHPKALMKFGSWHLYEGLSPTRMHTIGDFFSNVARFNGYEYLSINFVSRPEDLAASTQDIGFIWPFIRDLESDEFAIIDLRPFRRYPNRLLVEKAEGEEWVEQHKEDFVRLVYGYDLIFYIGQTRSATFEVAPQAE